MSAILRRCVACLTGIRQHSGNWISQLLGFRIVAINEAMAAIVLDADASRHGNQQGTVHGGLLCELADAAIGTAHSTLMQPGESFTSIDLKATFLRRNASAGQSPALRQRIGRHTLVRDLHRQDMALCVELHAFNRRDAIMTAGLTQRTAVIDDVPVITTRRMDD